MSDLHERVVATKMSSKSSERLQLSAQLKEVKERANAEWRWRLSIVHWLLCATTVCAKTVLVLRNFCPLSHKVVGDISVRLTCRVLCLAVLLLGGGVDVAFAQARSRVGPPIADEEQAAKVLTVKKSPDALESKGLAGQAAFFRCHGGGC